MVDVLSHTPARRPLSARLRLPDLRGLDPRVRVVVSVVMAIAIVACHSLPVLLAALALSLVLMVLMRLAPGPTLKRMAAVDAFILMLVAMLPFTTPGETAFVLFGLPATWEGLHLAAEIGLTANAIALMVLSLVGTLEPVTLGHALHSLKMPPRLVHLLMFTVRYIEVLNEERHRMRQAMMARGFKPKTNLHTYRTYGYLVGMVLIRAIERSERILGAMKCRGFQGRFPLLGQFRLRGPDIAFALAMAGLCFGFVAMDLSLAG